MQTTLLMCLIFLFCTFLYISTCISTSILTPCPLEKSCNQSVVESSAICGLDEDAGCIRKYASTCLMDIAACQKGKAFTDYSNVYCSMESYLCEQTPTYERWTIFFGFEKE
ncbi:uncharacterized protein LOC117895030 [Drosophila subobscura]|uniref:uncharacterized protein LOC117895030 n=1 Tax=Drosophila subobscura TaxID=7241 RepID=UPI00155B3213|nr:uncharacterized protein LOC117895030 [Drosophila subobscura]